MRLRLRKQNRNAFIVWALILFTSFLLMSCGARKKDKTHAEESNLTENVKQDLSQTKEDLNIKTAVEIKTNSQTGTVTKKTTYEPVDASKPATVIDKNGKKTELNNSKLTEEETTTNANTQKNEKNIHEDHSKKQASQQSKARQKTATKKANDNLHIDRKSNGWLSFLWLLIPTGLFVLYRKFKDKIWWM